MGVLTTLFLVINSTALASAAGVPIVGASLEKFLIVIFIYTTQF